MNVAVILAAGAGSRFSGDSHKLNALVRGRRVVDHAVDAVLAAVDSGAAIDAIIVVTGAADLSFSDPRIQTVANPNWRDGQATSLRTGLSRAAELGADAVIFGLGDQPGIDPSAWAAVAASHAPIAVATYPNSRTRTPALIRREIWADLPTSGDFGARHLISSRPELVEQVPCTGTPADIDTIEDLRTWNP